MEIRIASLIQMGAWPVAMAQAVETEFASLSSEVLSPCKLGAGEVDRGATRLLQINTLRVLLRSKVLQGRKRPMGKFPFLAL